MYDEDAIPYIDQLLLPELRKSDYDLEGVIVRDDIKDIRNLEIPVMEFDNIKQDCHIFLLYHYYGQRVRAVKKFISENNIEIEWEKSKRNV